MRRSFGRYGVILLLLTAGPLYGQSGSTAPISSSVLRPGDAIRITVWRQPDWSGEFNISDDGRIAHPIYQGIRVTGMPLGDVELRINTLLQQFETKPEFVIEPLLKVLVGGQVRQPNLYKLSPEMTVAEAVGVAGGITDQGKLESVHLFRDGNEVIVNLAEPQKGAAQGHIQSGDQIFVDRKVSVFREYIAPAGSITAALVAIIGLILRN